MWGGVVLIVHHLFEGNERFCIVCETGAVLGDYSRLTVAIVTVLRRSLVAVEVIGC